MDEKEIRSFLVAQPRGSRILVRTDDDEVHDIAGAGKGVTWAHVARSIDALAHVYLELQDSEGKLLRATRTRGEKADTVTASAITPVVHADPETARLTHFANLLSDAYKFSTGLAFAKMVELSQMSVDRMMAIETRLERTEANYRREMKERLDDAFEQAEDLAEEAEKRAAATANDPATTLLQQFAMGAAAGGDASPPNGVKKGSA